MIAVGVAAGLAGAAMVLLLRLVQHVAYGAAEDTFLQDVEHSAAFRRPLAMAVAGLLTGLGWWALRARDRPLPSVTAALATPARPLGVVRTTADALLQITAVGAGASLGREGAPRQVGAALAGWLAARARLAPGSRRTLLACGAGAGLAAVYNVPFSGALFTLEVLLASAALADVVPALATAGVATVVAWPIIGTAPTYAVPVLHVTPGLLVWAVLLGPLAGCTAVVFVRLTTAARTHAPPPGWRLPVTTAVAFAAVGALGIPFGAVLGNGKSAAQVMFSGGFALPALAALLVLKPLATAACLRSGAIGGLLTPSFATGALLGGTAGRIWLSFSPGPPLAAFAVIGAGAVLAITQRAPLTAVALVVEFTHSGLELVAPLLIAVAGAALTARALRHAPFGTLPPRATSVDPPAGDRRHPPEV